MLVQYGNVVLKYVPATENTTDVFLAHVLLYSLIKWEVFCSQEGTNQVLVPLVKVTSETHPDT